MMRIVKECDLWSCPTCAPKKADAVVTRLREVAVTESLHASDLTDDQQKAAARMARRMEVGYVGIKRHDETVLMVTDRMMRGRDWWLKAASLDNMAGRILSARVRRVDWCALWRTGDRRKEPTDRLVWRGQVRPSRVDAVLRDAGFGPDTDYVDCSPMEAGIRLGHALNGGGLDD